MNILSEWWKKLAGQKGNLLRLAGPISLGALNQAVRSGSNLLLGLYLINVLAPVDYGLFGIGFSFSFFLYGIASAVFFLQMVVHTPDKPTLQRPAYAADILVLVMLFCVAAIGIVMPLVVGAVQILLLPAAYASLSIAVIFASCSNILKDFFVRHAFNGKNEMEALRIDLILTGAMVLLLVWQYYQGFALTASGALWIYAAANMLAAIYGFVAARLPVSDVSVKSLRFAATEAWRGGRWESLTGIVFFGRSQAHIIATTYFFGPIGVANLNAARLLVSPALIVAPAISQVALPRIADLRKKGANAVLNNAFMVSIALLSVAIVYCILLLSGFDRIVPLLLDSEYSDIFYLTLAWCFFACFLAFRSGNQLGIHALRQFRFFASANATAAVTTILLACILTYQFGLIGAVSAAVLGELVLVSMMLQYGHRHLRKGDLA